MSATLSTNLRWSSNNSQLTPQQLYEQVTHGRILKGIYLWLLSKNKVGSLEQQLDLKENLKEIRDWDRGRCYTVHPSEEIRKFGIFAMHVYL